MGAFTTQLFLLPTQICFFEENVSFVQIQQPLQNALWEGRLEMSNNNHQQINLQSTHRNLSIIVSSSIFLMCTSKYLKQKVILGAGLGVKLW